MAAKSEPDDSQRPDFGRPIDESKLMDWVRGYMMYDVCSKSKIESLILLPKKNRDMRKEDQK